MAEISRRALQAAVEHARACAPRECCGVLLGAAGAIHAALPTRNAAAGLREFLIDDADLTRLLIEQRAAVRGVYHSHIADAALTPSGADRWATAEQRLGEYHLLVSPAGAWRMFAVRGARWIPLTCEIDEG